MERQSVEKVGEWRRLLASLRGAGVEPYPHSFTVEHSIKALNELRRQALLDPWLGATIRTAGRVTDVRRHPNVVFIDLYEDGARFQVMADPKLPILEHVWRGDFIGVEGPLVKTQRGDYAVKASSIVLLAKAVQPLPEWGKVDRSSPFYMRYRSVAMVLDLQLRWRVAARARLIQAFREAMWRRGFLEIPTPVLQPIYGGAAARPFTTKIWAIDEEWYLRISPELYLKRYIIAGFPKVFEIGPQFRNEDIDALHNPEFWSLEAYQAYADYKDIMRLTEEVVYEAVRAVLGTGVVKYREWSINFSPPWRRVTLHDALREFAGVDPDRLTDDNIKERLRELQVPLRVYNRGVALVKLFEKLVEKKLVQPTFVLDYPEESTPLCKPHREKAGLVERFEAFVGGLEVANAYTELNDPVKQYEFFAREEELFPKDEAHPLDWDFVEELSFGMPPTGGVGIGVDRLAMIITNAESIKDVIPYPIVSRRSLVEG
ncbi:Lysyl-tRNA synthetase (class II) [Pyrobaculum oguniense TE7]|uniref:Lysyl-tRNA synthetase (Class II) n=1 Tax=Pyrobaculum oguniense (strain DSM 13380 / JCM 10595 / TE7) TaxID=698757 RepID=H6QAN6_PYROT|nr:Lysyl-tRNA synthetase (class II) [Pyrobaculum oguniense TE7]